MFDGSTPTESDAPAPFAVGYGCGFGDEPSIRPPAAGPTPVAAPSAGNGSVDLRATVAVTPIDLGATRALAPVALAPFTARPVGAAHPRRRLGRGLVLGGLALLVAGSGIGAVALASGPEVSAAAASAHRSTPAAATATSTIGGRLGRGVDPSTTSTTEAPAATVPVSIIESPTITRVPQPAPTVVPTTAPPVTAPPTTTPPTTTPTTTTPPTTTPPTTTPTGPSFTTVNAPATAACPGPAADVTVSFSWTAADATKVTLSIDGPGIYRTYAGATGSETVSFSCSSPHTYLFTAYGAGSAVATRTVTVTPS